MKKKIINAVDCFAKAIEYMRDDHLPPSEWYNEALVIPEDALKACKRKTKRNRNKHEYGFFIYLDGKGTVKLTRKDR